MITNMLEQYKPVFELTNKENIKEGDVIYHENKCCTLTSEYIKYDNLMGITLYGDNYHCGENKVIKINHYGKYKQLLKDNGLEEKDFIDFVDKIKTQEREEEEYEL